MQPKLRDPAMFGIRYMAPKGRLPGYLVKLERNRQLHQKWFGRASYESLEAAKAWRDELAPTLPGVIKQEFVTILRPNNTSGVPGVMRVTQRRRYKSGTVWTCTYWKWSPDQSAPKR